MGCGCGKNKAVPVDDNQPAVGRKTYRERLKICSNCPTLKRWHDGVPLGADVGALDRCSDCGCFMTAKAFFPIFECPQGKW